MVNVPQRCGPDDVRAGAQVELGAQVVEDLVQELQARLLDLGEVHVVVAPAELLHATVEGLKQGGYKYTQYGLLLDRQ